MPLRVSSSPQAKTQSPAVVLAGACEWDRDALLDANHDVFVPQLRARPEAELDQLAFGQKSLFLRKVFSWRRNVACNMAREWQTDREPVS